ncbi:MAG TPA: glycosyltransferase family 1 protein, partial [Chryseosolibacter sp.]|nr:glycosyltransferase family 1 protein [Chryseosolibacter sp.]
MKIGIEVQRLFRKKKFGIETSSLELIKALQEIEPNHEFVIFTKDDEDRRCLAESDNLKIKTLDGKLFADFEQFFLPLAAKREQVDILHCTGNTAPYFSPVPVVQTLHDVIFMDSIPSEDSFYQRFGNLYRRRVVPVVTPRSKAIITVSHYEKERIMQRLGIPGEKVHVVYNGINERRFHTRYSSEAQCDVLNKYGLPKEFILFLGNLTTRKNPARAIEAYVRYASATSEPLAFVTPGLSKKFVINTLKHLHFPYDPAQFITPGYIDDADLPLVYIASKIFLFPSLSEGFGMPVIEAMACGTPV